MDRLIKLDDYGSISEQERQSIEEQLPDYLERKLGKELIAFVARKATDEGYPIYKKLGFEDMGQKY